jgi:hypothetical protein
MEPSAQLTPVAWQKFGDEYALTGQFSMRPIFLSIGLRPKPQLKLLNMENMLLVPFNPEHPHAQRIVDGWNNTEKYKALKEVAEKCLEDWDGAGYLKIATLIKLREILKS